MDVFLGHFLGFILRILLLHFISKHIIIVILPLSALLLPLTLPLHPQTLLHTRLLLTRNHPLTTLPLGLTPPLRYGQFLFGDVHIAIVFMLEELSNAIRVVVVVVVPTVLHGLLLRVDAG